MAAHGVARGTRDVDLLVVAPECLLPSTWETLGVDVDIRRGAADDPLAGVVRFSAKDVTPLDLVVGREPWQAALLARARAVVIEGVRVPVAAAADLILLKLYAGGPQDAWDIDQLLAVGDRAALVTEVERSLGALPREAHELWNRVRR